MNGTTISVICMFTIFVCTASTYGGAVLSSDPLPFSSTDLDCSLSSTPVHADLGGPVPEPVTILLFASGAISLCRSPRRR